MPVDPEQMSEEELESALSGAEVRTPGYPPEHEPDPEPVEEAPVEPAEQQVEPAPDTPEQAPEETQEETPADDTPTAEDISALEREELIARLEATEAQAKKWEQVAGRHGGRMGFLENRLKALSQQPAVPMNEDTEYGEQEQATQRPQRPAAPSTDPMTTWAVQQAMQSGVSEFRSKYPDSAEHDQAIGQYLNSQGYNTAPILESNDPSFAQNETRRVLEEAYWHVISDVRNARKAELAERRASQTEKLKAAKQRAAPSATATTAPPKPKAKSEADMSDEELDAAMRKATAGQRWY